MHGLGFRQIGRAEEHAPDLIEDNSSGTYCENIAKRRSELAAADRRAEIGDFIATSFAPVATDNIGERGSRHGRLLGGKRQSENLEEQEADRVVRAHENRFDEGRPVPTDNVK